MLSEFAGEGLVYSGFYLTFIFPNHQLQISHVGAERATPANPQVCIAPDIPIDVFISLGADDASPDPLCEFFNPSTGRDWGKQLNKEPQDFLALIGTGNFCLPPK